MLRNIKSKLKFIPEKPGVYLFKGEADKIIYIGKAKSLKKRVASYFSKAPDSKKTELILRDLKNIEYIVASSELEALMLESNLIKKFRPRYNIVLRDDKQYPYLKLTLNEEWPRLIIVRRIEKDGAKYFGPMSGGAARDVIRLVKRLFPIRWCKETPLKKRKQPCMYYHIGRCIGPCAEEISREEYIKLCRAIMCLIEGDIDETIKELQTEMEEASRELQFERAKLLRDRLIKLKKMSRGQRVVSQDLEDRDVIAISRVGERACAVIFHVRRGKLVGRDFFYPHETAEATDEELLTHSVIQYYMDVSYIPGEIIVENKVLDAGLVESLLEKTAGKRVNLRVEEKAPLVKMAKENSRLLLERKIISQAEGDLGSLEDLKQKLKLDVLPVRIEAFDVSNISGTDIVGSMVTFVGGLPYKRDYRRFEVKSVKKADDIAAIYEIVKRRYSGSLKLKLGLPDLVLVDGGIGQVRAGRKGLKDSQISHIPIISLAKKFEDVYVPSRSKPLKIGKDSKALRLLQRIRDEAHRFAVTYHRKKREKQLGESALDGISGLGKDLKKRLLNKFKDVKTIREASPVLLSKVKGISLKLAKRIIKELRT